MPSKITRREFLTAAAGATTLGLGGCLGSTDTCAPGPDGKVTCALPQPSEAPFDTVVVLMMENRSFDHFLGWLPGANGRQQGLSYADEDGVVHATWPLAPDFQGCQYQDPDHTWKGIATQYADGRCDGFLKTRTDRNLPADHLPHRLLRQGRSADSCRARRGLHDVRQLFLLDAGADLGEPALSAHRDNAGGHGRGHRSLSHARMPSGRAPFRLRSSTASAQRACARAITITASR